METPGKSPDESPDTVSRASSDSTPATPPVDDGHNRITITVPTRRGMKRLSMQREQQSDEKQDNGDPIGTSSDVGTPLASLSIDKEVYSVEPLDPASPLFPQDNNSSNIYIRIDDVKTAMRRNRMQQASASSKDHPQTSPPSQRRGLSGESNRRKSDIAMEKPMIEMEEKEEKMIGVPTSHFNKWSSSLRICVISAKELPKYHDKPQDVFVKMFLLSSDRQTKFGTPTADVLMEGRTTVRRRNSEPRWDNEVFSEWKFEYDFFGRKRVDIRFEVWSWNKNVKDHMIGQHTLTLGEDVPDGEEYVAWLRLFPPFYEAGKVPGLLEVCVSFQSQV